MPIYNIPIIWESYRRYQVEAEDLQSAVTQALKEFLNEPDDHYIQDSFEIDSIIDDEYPDEDFDIDECIQKL